MFFVFPGGNYPVYDNSGPSIGAGSTVQFVVSQANEPKIGPLPSYSPEYNTTPFTTFRPAAATPVPHLYHHQQQARSGGETSPYSSFNVDFRVILGDSDLPYTVLEREGQIPRPPTGGDMSTMMSFFTQVARITDNLYLCAAAAVTNNNLKQHGITHVINLTLDVPCCNAPHVETTRVSVDDVPHANLGIYFDRLADKIRSVKERGGRTLVHCVAGVSRSASTCIAYLMKYYQMPLVEAYRYVKKQRAVIRPNVGFFRQLIEYERKLFGRNSVRMVESGMGLIPDVYKEETRGMVFLNPAPGMGRSRRGYSNPHFGR